MSQEHAVTHIRINIKEGFIETRTKDGSGIRQEFETGIAIQLTPFGKDGEGATRKALAASQAASEPAPLPDAQDQASEAAPTRKEKTPATVIPGRLKNQPKEGRPDSNGKPTAWAHFLGHLEGVDGAVLISASFHNH